MRALSMPLLLIASTLCANADPRDPAREPAPAAGRIERGSGGMPSVRGAGRLMRQVIADGIARSPTFAALVAELGRTNVIVYVEGAHVLPANIAARLSFLGASQTEYRYLRVQVHIKLDPNERLALVAHELQHALEVARSPAVRDERTLELLYQEIGERHRIERQYDTAAARETGRQVRHELRTRSVTQDDPELSTL